METLLRLTPGCGLLFVRSLGTNLKRHREGLGSRFVKEISECGFAARERSCERQFGLPCSAEEGWSYLVLSDSAEVDDTVKRWVTIDYELDG